MVGRLKHYLASFSLGIAQYLACRLDHQSRRVSWRQAWARMRLHEGYLVTL